MYTTDFIILHKHRRELPRTRPEGRRSVRDELGPLPLIITRIAMNRYTVESRALLRVCLAVAATEGEMVARR